MPVHGANTALLCPDNTFTPYYGMGACQPCPPGTTRDTANQANASIVGCLNAAGVPIALAAYSFYLPDVVDTALLPSTDTKKNETITYSILGGIFGLATVVVIIVFLVKRNQKGGTSYRVLNK